MHRRVYKRKHAYVLCTGVALVLVFALSLCCTITGSRLRYYVTELLSQPFDLDKIFECGLQPSLEQRSISKELNLPMCPCVPKGLNHYRKFDASRKWSYAELRPKYTTVQRGHWKPAHCLSRYKIAVIIPYRDREDQLPLFLNVIHSFLQNQLHEYTIVVAEQVAPDTFNKAKVMNAAYLEVKKLSKFDCYIFHDVDMIPEDERNLYSCPSTIRHQGLALNTALYRMVHEFFIGGVSVFRPEAFEKVNGYSNRFWGWGGEDDDMWRRTVDLRIPVLRPPLEIASYHMISHERDNGNPQNSKRFEVLKENKMLTSKMGDGLSTVIYKLRFIRTKQLYTWIAVDVSEGGAAYE